MTPSSRPFQLLGPAVRPSEPLRDAIIDATRLAEPTCVQALLNEARLPVEMQQAIQAQALNLTERLRQREVDAGRAGLVQALMQEFALSTQEGISLMCLAEALLRIPDEATRDALIRDKLADGNWAAHLGHSPSLFVNAATWGLLLSGRLVGTHGETGLSAALRRVAVKGGEPLIRRAVHVAMRMLGEQFVMGERIERALSKAQAMEARGFLHSYDMLGEAALTEVDAQRYADAYQAAILAIGKTVNGRDLYRAPGLSIKLSALHPRYSRAQYARVMDELYPRLLRLARLARQQHIGINIDAEESERLMLSLDLLERLCTEPDLQGWDGIGFVVQAYQKRAPMVIDYLVGLARRSRHRLMVRLVKGAYWDREIKQAQLEGLTDYPVYTRKPHTDLSYLVCARKMLAAPDAVYPQFATHNAHTLATVYHLAGRTHRHGQYEFQCLHGMGEPLYEMVIAGLHEGGLACPCRIYAPVGTHDTLLAYLVRRLLENGANASFVNQVADKRIPLASLVEDPCDHIVQQGAREGGVGQPHPAIVRPEALYAPQRRNAPGWDLHCERTLQTLQQDLAPLASQTIAVAPMLGIATDAACAPTESHPTAWQPCRNPADRKDLIGQVRFATLGEVQQAMDISQAYFPTWRQTPVRQRAELLDRAAQLLHTHAASLVHLLVREAGKTVPNALGEVREAIDFLRYYAAQARADLHDGLHVPLGPVVCISPWNFPLAIFIGQIAAALVAGNTVLAKPAEQTPLVAAQAVGLLHAAGIPREALQCLPGPGDTIGAALVAHVATSGVLFTGSTQVARQLQAQLASRLDAQARPLPLIAETGGINTLIVDSSALPEQLVWDALVSAFDSAGQRCSALRVLCVQEDVADRMLTLLRGAMAEWRPGPPDRLHTDMGPLIDHDAWQSVTDHIEAMRQAGRPVFQAPSSCERVQALCDGHFIAPTLIELDSLPALQREVFGPVLHVMRYRREHRDALLAQIHAWRYGLTMGLHSRIDETIEALCDQARIGNLYVNRNMIGAVVGVQPFGGEGLSGTGPKAGGPLYLHRLVQPQAATLERATNWQALVRHRNPQAAGLLALQALRDWLAHTPLPHADVLRRHCEWLLQHSPAGHHSTLDGPTGERNVYRLRPREGVLCIARQHSDLLYQLAVVLAVDAHARWLSAPSLQPLQRLLPEAVNARITWMADLHDAPWEAVLMHGSAIEVIDFNRQLAQRAGPIVAAQALPSGWRQPGGFSLTPLFKEQVISTNTAAAGGNASLMSLGGTDQAT